MKVLIVGDAVVSTGFSRCTHALADELYKRGHDVAVLGINYWGDPHKYPYAIFPPVNFTDGGKDQFGVGRLPKLIHRFSPDVVVLLNDPWNLQDYFDGLDKTLEEDYPLPKMVGWLAVDSENHKLGAMNRLDAAVVWTKFGQDVLTDAGCTAPISIVPLGIDPSKFRPVDRTVARKLSMPEGDDSKDLFVVGVVGRNQYRKRLDLTIRSFALAVDRAPDPDKWRLFLHVAPTGDSGYDLRAISDYYGVRKRIILSNPGLGTGLAEDQLSVLYSSFDVYLSTSQGEGWGLPAQEAMACRIPCVLPAWGSFGPQGWVGPGEAYLVPCDTHLATAPATATMHTIGGVPDAHQVGQMLRAIHRDRGQEHRSGYLDKAEAKARSLTWSMAGEKMADVLESI